MASCSYYVDADGDLVTVEDSENIPDGIRRVDEGPTYVLEYFDPAELSSWVWPLVFTWPVLAVVLLRWRKKGRLSLLIRLLEPILLAISIAGVDFVSTFMVNKREIGAYMAFVGLGLYGIGIIVIDLALFRTWKMRNAPDGDV